MPKEWRGWLFYLADDTIYWELISSADKGDPVLIGECEKNKQGGFTKISAGDSQTRCHRSHYQFYSCVHIPGPFVPIRNCR